jgi:hypothetical protein
MRSIFYSFVAVALIFTFIPTAQGADMVIGEVSPLSAQYYVPQTYYATASDSDGIASCELVVSTIYRTPMTYNLSLSRWEVEYTFDTERTANSIRMSCEDNLGNSMLGPTKLIAVSHVPLDSTDGDSTSQPESEVEIDATQWSRQQVVDVSPVLIKTVCPGGEEVNHPCRTVYFLDDDGYRHAFPNEKTYFTWYESFDGIHLVKDSTMASYQLAGNVRYHPGKRMIKFPSVNTVYAVQQFGILRPIGGEEVAVALYGADWNQKIDDVSEAFFGNYTIYGYINSEHDYNVDRSRTSVASINDNKNILDQNKLLQETYSGGYMSNEDNGNALGVVMILNDGRLMWQTRYGELIRSDYLADALLQDFKQTINTTSFPEDVGTSRAKSYCPSAADGIDVEYVIYDAGIEQTRFSNCNWDFISHPFFDKLTILSSQ